MIEIKGRAICAARDLLKLTQHELAAACKISKGTLSGIEGETTKPHAATIRKIAQELTTRGIEFSNGTGIGIRLDYRKAAAYAAAKGDETPVDPNLG